MITSISKAICEHFTNEGYIINEKDNCFGGKEISITKGGFFKSIIGMKTALNISLRPGKDHIDFEAGIGIFGLHAIPTIITTFCFWPLILTQIWGLVKQSKLDDTALEIARETIEKHWSANMGGHPYCTNCGKDTDIDANFCPHCGHAMSA